MTTPKASPPIPTANGPSKLGLPYPLLLVLGPIVLFVVACAYGVLEVHSSTDTWIGLAAGKQIHESNQFPRNDTFSYTFYGQPWYNQNWLTHICQYWLYLNYGPNAVIYGTWAMAASIFVLVLLAAYWKTDTWIGAALVASVVALGCRDYLSARPATTGFFLMAVALALICALEAPRRRWSSLPGEKPAEPRERWWPIVLVLPLLLFWGNAHGSFIFGYGVFGLYLAHWCLGWVIARARGEGAPVRSGWLNISQRQVIGIATAMVLAFILTWMLGPFGFENFTHGEKIRGSETFRKVSEWLPPSIREVVHPGWTWFWRDPPQNLFPHTWRFWWVLLLTTALLSFLALLGFASEKPAPEDKPAADRRGSPARRKEPRRSRGIEKPPWIAGVFRSLALFDLAMVVLGLCMTIWARRFAPVFFIFGGPAILALIVMLVRSLSPDQRRWMSGAMFGGAWIAAAAVAIAVGTDIRDDLIKPYRDRPQFAHLNLLERVTRYDATPQDSILFLKNNEVQGNLLTEWTQGGPLMFHVPGVRLFMDGRAQQVFDEATYKDLESLMAIRWERLSTPQQQALVRAHAEQILDRPSRAAAMPDGARTDIVLMRASMQGRGLTSALNESRVWAAVYMGFDSVIFMRRESEPFRKLAERAENDTEWRPRESLAVAALGNLFLAMRPPKPMKALEAYQESAELDFSNAPRCFPAISRIMEGQRMTEEARKYIAGQRERLRSDAGKALKPEEQAAIANLLDQWEAALPAGPTTAPATQPARGPEDADKR